MRLLGWSLGTLGNQDRSLSASAVIAPVCLNPDIPCDTLALGIASHLSSMTNGIGVFPNPSNGIFSLQLADGSDKIEEVHVTDILGKEIFSKKNISSFIDLSKEDAGIYFVRITTMKSNVIAVKLVKE
jgi:hypothetical protein